MPNVRWKQIVLAVIVIGVFCISLLIAIANRHFNIDASVKFVSLFLSWPVAVLILGIIFLSRFRASIDSFLRNIRSVTLPGAQVQMQTPAPADSEKGRESTSITLTEQQSQQLGEFIKGLMSHVQLAGKQKEEWEQQRTQLWAMVYGWKFTYLNFFYVPLTKHVLAWFARTPQTEQSFHQSWEAAIPNPEQRTVILSVLTQYEMLRTDGDKYEITPEGYAFLQFIGLIPYAPT